MTWETVQSTEKPERHHGIKCLDCGMLLYRKTQALKHPGHTVVYLDKDGEPVK